MYSLPFNATIEIIKLGVGKIFIFETFVHDNKGYI